ncbi:MAG: c-type cytochrome [Candidatus Nitrospinota bacterium M3_3B_026]
MRNFRGAGVLPLILGVLLMAAGAAQAKPGNADNGKKIYDKRCWWCHGKEGEADGPAAERMIPPPRDFSFGIYKFKTSPPDAFVPRDEDLYYAIAKGLSGTAMPAWEGVLKEQEMWDLVAYIKALTDMFEGADNPAEISLSGKIESSPESIEKGKKAFDAAKCWECHGREGKGNMIKKLKEDSGIRVWPRNLAKAWTFRGPHTPEAIYTRVTNGIPNTPMPSFKAEKTGNGKLSEEDRWHVANYVMSLADETRQVKEGETVVRGIEMPELPKDEKDPAWDAAQSTAFHLAPQIIEDERLFTPTNDLIQVKAAFNEEEVAFLLIWDDRTKSVPGDSDAEAIAWGEMGPDAVAIQTPVDLENKSEKPYFGHGDKTHSVSMLYWNSGSVDGGDVSAAFTATGSGTREKRDADSLGYASSASYHEGTWKVMMKRKLAGGAPGEDTQFMAGEYVPVAFANWDGSNGEAGSKHTLTAWWWLLLKPTTGSEIVLYPAVVFVLLVGGQFLFAGYLRKS